MSIEEYIDIDLTRINENHLAYRIIKKEEHEQEHIMTQGYCCFNHVMAYAPRKQ
jgi:hypothetical protein